MSFNLLKSSVFATAIFLCVGLSSSYAGPGYDYQLYKNPENFGIVVFPKDFMFSELDGYIASLSFEPAESGKAVMRYGSKNENSTYMMPLEIQKKHSIEKFIVIQILGNQSMLIAIFDPEWGLTLPSTMFQMDALKRNIPKTLNLFRGTNSERLTRGRIHAPRTS